MWVNFFLNILLTQLREYYFKSQDTLIKPIFLSNLGCSWIVSAFLGSDHLRCHLVFRTHHFYILHCFHFGFDEPGGELGGTIGDPTGELGGAHQDEE